ncbi:MAG: hypothetical protein ACI8S6_004595 [Myxococcota bacterium]|jgi:hypothetical protein
MRTLGLVYALLFGMVLAYNNEPATPLQIPSPLDTDITPEPTTPDNTLQ